MDKDGNYYLAGNYTPDLNGSFVTQERTITQLNSGGKFNWSSMEGYYSYVSTVVDEDVNEVLTLSGPNSSLVPTSLTVQKFDKNGNLILSGSLNTLADDRPVTWWIFPVRPGYLAVGVYDTAGIHRPMVARLNTDLELVWSQVYEMNAHFIEVTGAGVAGEGHFGISGYLEDTPGAREEAYLLVGDLENGEPEFFKSFQHSKGFATYANTLVAIPPEKPGQEPVWVLGGAFDNASNDQRSFACKSIKKAR